MKSARPEVTLAKVSRRRTAARVDFLSTAPPVRAVGTTRFETGRYRGSCGPRFDPRDRKCIAFTSQAARDDVDAARRRETDQKAPQRDPALTGVAPSERIGA